jgi:phosphoribosylformimino-5-aminoimidazole carboxamide ribotide isomerase
MKKLEVIPAMDLMGGQCVRLQQGDFERRRNYSANPLQVAKQFEAAGFHRLHLVDLDGARAACPCHLPVLQQICAETSLVVDFSGGIQSSQDLRRVFDAGAAMAAIGSLVVNDTDRFLEWLDCHGPDRLLAGLDVRGGYLSIRGWTQQTKIHIADMLERLVSHGLKQVFCTDIDRDGLLQGPAKDLYKGILDVFPDIELIASGGIRHPGDLLELEQTGCSGAIVGKALYEQRPEQYGNWLRFDQY